MNKINFTRIVNVYSLTLYEFYFMQCEYIKNLIVKFYKKKK